MEYRMELKSYGVGLLPSIFAGVRFLCSGVLVSITLVPSDLKVSLPPFSPRLC